jgi:hypothetical protein
LGPGRCRRSSKPTTDYVVTSHDILYFYFSVRALSSWKCVFITRLGGAVAVGMGNTLGPGETGRRCMVISRGASTRGLTGVQCGKRRGPQRGVCAPATTKSRGVFLQSDCLAIACFLICSPLGHSLLLHFSAVRLATACSGQLPIIIRYTPA